MALSRSSGARSAFEPEKETHDDADTRPARRRRLPERPRRWANEILDRGLEPYDAVATDGHEYRLHISPEAAGWLQRLQPSHELVWCTTWRNANEVISPLVGLPRDLRQVWLPTELTGEPQPDLCWKTPFIRRWAAENNVNRLARIDDEVSASDATALTADLSSHAATSDWHPTLIGIPPLDDVLVVPTDPAVGFRKRHIRQIEDWATGRQLDWTAGGDAALRDRRPTNDAARDAWVAWHPRKAAARGPRPAAGLS